GGDGAPDDAGADDNDVREVRGPRHGLDCRHVPVKGTALAGGDAFLTPSFTAGYEGHMMAGVGTPLARADAEFQGESVMFANRLTIGVLAVACVAAAGAGSYFATRQNTGSAPATTVASAAPTSPDAGAAPLDRPVQETEAVVAPERAGSSVATLGTSTNASAPSRRAEPARAAAPSRTASATSTKSASSSTTARTNTPALER